MSQAQIIPHALAVEDGALVSTSGKAVSIPWTVWFTAAGITVNAIGGIWDDTWHSSIGVDTSWAPPHMLLQISPVLPLIACIYEIVTTTFTAASWVRASSVRVLGLYARSGTFMAAWGCIATLVAGPFDNWWHQAYGEPTIATPPHLLFLFGSLATQIGGMAWIASLMNTSTDGLRVRLTWLFLFICSLGVANFASSVPGAASMHRADCYLAFALYIPCWLIACGRGAPRTWGLTIVAAGYMVISLGLEWLLPLFPAQPKFGPVYHNVTHLIPPGFPLLLVLPAIVADWLSQKLAQRSAWTKAVCVGPGLVISFLAVQWPFADFLLSPASRNWVFGTAYFSYRDPAGFLYEAYKFKAAENLNAFLLTIVAALLASIVTTRFGLAWGDWMRRVRR